MQHDFIFQLTFYPFQDKIKRLSLTISQIQYKYTPNTTVILLLIQTSAIRYRLDTLQTRRPFYLSFRFNYQLQVQICSKHGCHSDLYTSSLIIPSAVATEVILSLIQILVTVSDTLQTRKAFCYSYRSQFQIQSRYAPDTVTILSLIRNLSPAQRCSIH